MPASSQLAPVLVLSQGDPAGVGPEILCKLLSQTGPRPAWRPLLVAERAAIEAVPPSVRESLDGRLEFLAARPDRATLDRLPADRIPVLDPVDERRPVRPGRSAAADAAGALAALDAAAELAREGVADALITAPISKSSIARHCRPDFRGHTEYLAHKAGLERYGRDYLMAFLTPDLQVALLTTHLPLARALTEVRAQTLIAALELLHRTVGGRIGVAGLNPHAGERGLLGSEEDRVIGPAVETARRAGIDAHGPESPDSLFARARRGEFAWVLALYHDQGLIAVKTSAFGAAANWTLGLPYVRTSVDHGTAFEIAGRGLADPRPLGRVVEITLGLLSGELPRK